MTILSARVLQLPVLTALAVGCLAWITRALGHELIGHGGACVLVGDTPIAFNAMYFQGGETSSYLTGKFRLAGGTIYNVITALLCIWLLVRYVIGRSWFAYFLWITAIMSLLQAGSYVAFGRFVHDESDWAVFLHDLDPAWFWSLAEWVVGIGLLVAGVATARKFERRFLSSDSTRQDKRKLYLLPYFAAVVVSVSASLIVPSDMRIWMVLGGLGNAFTFMLPMLVLAFVPTSSDLPEETGAMVQHRGIIATGLVCTLLFVFVVGRGINF
jgi:hypothetical protein